MINKIVRRSLFKSKILLFSVFILFFLAVSLLTVSQITYDDISNTYNDYKSESNFEDFRFSLINELEDYYDNDFEKDFEKDYNVDLEKVNYKTINEEDITYNITKYDEATEINKIKIEEGSLPTKDNEILLTPGVMERKGLSVGSEVKLDNKTYTISGSGYMPEFTFPIDVQSGTFSIGSDTFIPVYMNGKSFDNLKTNVLSYYKGTFVDEKPDKVLELYKEISEEVVIEVPKIDEYGLPQIDETGEILTEELSLVPSIIDSEYNPSTSSFENEINGEKAMMSTMAIVIIIIALLITVVLFNSIFNSQKREIGIQKAEGILPSKLGKTYLKYLTILLLTSSLLGFLLGWYFKGAITELLRGLFSFPLVQISNAVVLKGIFVVLLAVITVLLVVYFVAIRRNLNTKPLLLIKNIDTEKDSKIKLNFLTKNLKFKSKYKVNLLLRTLPMSFLLAFGVFVSSFLLLMGGIAYNTTNQLVNNTYNEKYTYDYEVVYSPGKIDEEFDNNSIISISTQIDSISSDVELKPFNSIVPVYGYNFEDNDYINLKSEEENKLESDKIYLSSLASDMYDLEIGDTIKVTNPFENDTIISMEVGGILDDSLNSKIYMDITKAQELFDFKDDYANGEVGAGDKKTEILKYDENAGYNEVTSLEDNLENMLNLMTITITTISVIAVTISFITLSMIVAIVIKKNKKTISVMKVLGYKNSEISQMTTAPYKWILIIVYFASIPLFEAMIQAVLSKALGELDISINISIGLVPIVFGFIIIFLVYNISLLIAKRSINKIKLAESLKTDE